MNHLFKTKLNAACFVLIPACIGINYLGKLFASVLKLPLWLHMHRSSVRRAGHRSSVRSGQ